MKHTKDGKNLNALLRRAMLGVLDIMLFAMANCSICYLTMSGHIMATDYKYMIFNYLHFGLTSVLLVGINSAFGLYRSVWYFAGSDEIVKSFLGALVNAVQLFLCDRFLFAKLLHTKGYLPYYAYILFFCSDVRCHADSPDRLSYSTPICAQSGGPTERPKAYYDRGCRIYGQLYH